MRDLGLRTAPTGRGGVEPGKMGTSGLGTWVPGAGPEICSEDRGTL